MRSRRFVASTIIGATSVAQLDELAREFDRVLPAEILAEIDAINRVHFSPSAQ